MRISDWSSDVCSSDLAKDSAREALCDFLGTHPGVRLWVRINDASTAWHDDDLKACRNYPGVAAIVLPKTETQAHVDRKSDVSGKCVTERADMGGRGTLKQKKQIAIPV